MSSYTGLSSFLSGANETYIAELYERYLRDPGSVDSAWAEVFQDLQDGPEAIAAELRGASWAPRTGRVVGVNGEHPALADAAAGIVATPAMPAAGAPVASAEQIRRATLDSIRALMLIRAYRVRGHLHATLDPLGLEERPPHAELDPATYGFSEADLDRPIFINYVLGLESATLREIVSILNATYCGNIGVEFMHIQEPEEKAWIQERIENIRNQTQFTKRGKVTILERLTEAQEFETFLDKRYTGTKRFGLDGGESTVPALEQILKRGAQLGIQEIVLGMAHRGRLNVLANIMHKPYRAIFSEFQGASHAPEDVGGSGDVKYHLGTSADREFDDRLVHLSLTANPSHLEAVNTVVLGKVRAKQRQYGDTQHDKVMGVLLHGDAAFAGQGMVAETFDLSQLKGYRTGGTIHFVINNQIGFTTSPSFSRSSPYCSDVAKMVQAPIFHVNGDDPEACVHVARIATEFRQRFKKDVVIDLFCYRRHGHNEADEPAFTQPRMYRTIKAHPRVRDVYAERLEAEGVIGPGEADWITAELRRHLEEEYEAATSYKPNKADWFEGQWAGLSVASGDERRGETAVGIDLLREVGHAISAVPKNVAVHPKIVRQLQSKRKMIEDGAGIDWATAEALAFGTLLCESTPVRLSGQDSARGTFSQRHAVLVDQNTENRYIPLNNIRFGQAPFEVIDSPLSEVGVLGFEYGYSLSEPHALVLWEAQFGDFANGAQVIIDQFISPGEHKWLRMSGLVMLLPHGYEGQGPEHSSARLERYLQLSAEDNWQVVNCTTPAQYFHVLRRQMHRNFRKPLVIMTPKSLLRHKSCVSRLDEFTTGTTFHRVMYDNEALCEDAAVQRVVLCSGKVYYDLFEERAERGIEDVFFLRMEQLYPFPRKALKEQLARFPAAEIVWCQEEPKNMGAWSYAEPRIEEVLLEIGAECRRPVYVGRPEAAAPATGLLRRHIAEQKELVDRALTIDAGRPRRAAGKPARKSKGKVA
ncbi:MAG: 2-oxoglutarate dehydrogenase E1 component [Rhodospirillales bacterium]|nr:MAG: 2-oxoglutarate dehydrogenase E1 component [Rhodospirillales bacterium]